MDLATAALIFATNLTNKTWPATWGPYDRQTMSEVVSGIVAATSEPQMVEMLIKIARWESGGWRRDVITCAKNVGYTRGAFQVYPVNAQERKDVCSGDFTKQAAVALTHLKQSIGQCKRMGFSGSNLITVYTHGQCHVAKDNLARMRWSDGKVIQTFLDEAIRPESGDTVL